MFQKLVSHNEDIRHLVEKGYAVGFDSNYLIIRDIPYLDSELKLQIGAIVTKLRFIDNEKIEQEDHQVFFAGSNPYNINGSPIRNLGGGPINLALSEDSKDVKVQRSFSNKPRSTGKFKDFFDKIESYVLIISGPAIELHDANPYTFRVSKNTVANSVFKFHDTLTSRAEIVDLQSKFKDEVIAIIGIGGTGAYILDFLVKTPIKEIRVFDFDKFHVHNAYRSPGRQRSSEFDKLKVQVYRKRYSNFRTGLSFRSNMIDSSCTSDLKNVTFAFVCVDKGVSRSNIFDLLLLMKIPFIDVGMGLYRKQDSLNGMIRSTYYSIDDGLNIRKKKFAPEKNDQNDLYRTNIQISELNALNACLAVIKFKQICGFYYEEESFYSSLFEIGDFKFVRESEIDKD